MAHVGGQELQNQADVFDEMFTLFLVFGTLVGVVVISYMLHKAYSYREGRADDDGFEAPTLGELPRGADKGGKKLFVSFGISAVIVVSLVAFAYTALLYVEAGPTEQVDSEEVIEVNVTAFAFGWEFDYPNGETTFNTLRVPEGKVVDLTVTSRDVWHTFSSRELNAKTDAIPGQESETWFIAEEEGEYRVVCDELCGDGHSTMNGEVVVLPEEEFLDWYEEELDGDRDEVYGGDVSEVGGVTGPEDDNTSDEGDGGDAGDTSDEDTDDGNGTQEEN